MKKFKIKFRPRNELFKTESELNDTLLAWAVGEVEAKDHIEAAKKVFESQGLESGAKIEVTYPDGRRWMVKIARKMSGLVDWAYKLSPETKGIKVGSTSIEGAWIKSATEEQTSPFQSMTIQNIDGRLYFNALFKDQDGQPTIKITKVADVWQLRNPREGLIEVVRSMFGQTMEAEAQEFSKRIAPSKETEEQ